MGSLLYGTGRRMQRIALFLFLVAVCGLPFALVAPRSPGLALGGGLIAASMLRLRRRHR